MKNFRVRENENKNADCGKTSFTLFLDFLCPAGLLYGNSANNFIIYFLDFLPQDRSAGILMKISLLILWIFYPPQCRSGAILVTISLLFLWIFCPAIPLFFIWFLRPAGPLGGNVDNKFPTFALDCLPRRAARQEF